MKIKKTGHMHIVLGQINPIIGDLKGNRDKIIQCIENAKSLSAKIILFSELALCGYPPKDLLLDQDFIKENEFKLNEIIEVTKGITAVVGVIRLNKTGKGKSLYNSAAIISNQKLIGFYDKILLPTYDVFDELRYFEPGLEVKTWNIEGLNIAVTICEDIWQSAKKEDSLSDPGYHRSPVGELKKLKPDLILNLSSSPFCSTHFEKRRDVCSYASKELSAPLFYCNQVGANDSLIFDGYSMVYNKEGELVQLAKGFEEDSLLVDFPVSLKPLTIERDLQKDLFEALCLGLRDYFHKLGFKKAVLGLSGGIDSALVACIAVAALGKENVDCFALPSRFSTNEGLIEAKILSQNLGCDLDTISIEPPFSSYLDLMEPYFKGKPFDVTEENLQARVRGMILMAISNKFGSLVLATGNKSEMALGYCTLYGDMCGSLAVISDLTKTQVYALARWINKDKEIIPWATIRKPPSAELKLNQKDQDTLPEYDLIDQVIESYLEDHLTIDEISEKFKFPLNVVKDLIKRIHLNEYKRKQASLGLRVSEKALTVGRHIPIVQQWIGS